MGQTRIQKGGAGGVHPSLLEIQGPFLIFKQVLFVLKLIIYIFENTSNHIVFMNSYIQGVLSSGGFVLRGFCPQGVLFRGFCPQGFLSGYRIYWAFKNPLWVGAGTRCKQIKQGNKTKTSTLLIDSPRDSAIYYYCYYLRQEDYDYACDSSKI